MNKKNLCSYNQLKFWGCFAVLLLEKTDILIDVSNWDFALMQMFYSL